MTSYFYAIKTLIEHRINELPLTSKTLEEMIIKEGWKIAYFNLNAKESLEMLEKLNILEYAQKYNGFSLKKDRFQSVFLKSNLSSANTAFVLAHELGHIKIGHFSNSGVLGKHSDTGCDDQQEAEANAFARHLLAPECILKKIHVETINDLESHTLLKGDVLKAHYTDYKFCKKGTTPEEDILIGNFTNYIKKHRKRDKLKRLFIRFLIPILVFIFILISYSIAIKIDKIPLSSNNYVLL